MASEDASSEVETCSLVDGNQMQAHGDVMTAEEDAGKQEQTQQNDPNDTTQEGTCTHRTLRYTYSGTTHLYMGDAGSVPLLAQRFNENITAGHV